MMSFFFVTAIDMIEMEIDLIQFKIEIYQWFLCRSFFRSFYWTKIIQISYTRMRACFIYNWDSNKKEILFFQFLQIFGYESGEINLIDIYFLGLGSVWGSRSLTQSAIEREVNSQLTQVWKKKQIFSSK
jgi:hypothetical protein